MAKLSEKKKRQVATKLRRKFQIEAPMLDAVIDVSNMYWDWTPKDVYEEVKRIVERESKRFKERQVKTPRFKGEMCSKRTVERIVQKYRLEADAWSIEDNPGEDSRIILTVLRNVILCTEGKKRRLSTNEADHILRLSKILPHLSPWEIWQLVRVYLLAEAKGESTEELDNLLAFRAWQDEDWWTAHQVANQQGWVKLPPWSWDPDIEAPLHIPEDQLKHFLLRFGWKSEKVASLFGMPEEAVKAFEETVNRQR